VFGKEKGKYKDKTESHENYISGKKFWINGNWQQQKKLCEMTETEEGTEEYNNRINIIQCRGAGTGSRRNRN
jgi:hypothetical protein